MSRCFPFPPPGYEKKIKLDEASLITNEKHKEKKHKKDKEKKDRSERKEKSKGEKHKDDKDRKEKKHRDKKHKKRDKHKSSDEKKNARSLENENGEKVVSDSKPNTGIQDSKILAELGKRLRNDEGAVDNCLLQKITPVDQGKPKLLEKVDYHGDSKVAHSNEHIREKRELSKMAGTQHLKVNARDLENGFTARFSGQVQGEIQNKAEGISRQVGMHHEKNEEKERNKDGNGSEHRKHEQRDKSKKAEDKKSKKEKKEEMDSIKKPIKNEGNSGKSSDFREPSYDSMECLERRGNLPKCKDPESNGVLQDNGIRLNSVSRAVSFSHQGAQNGSNSHPTQSSTNIASGKAALTSNHKVNADIGRATPNNHMVSNGFVTSPLSGIGKKTGLCQATPKLEHRVINSHRVDERPSHSLPPSTEIERNIIGPKFDKTANIGEKDLRKNGIIEGIKEQTQPKPSPSSTKAKEKSEKSKKDKSNKSTKKDPHPDLKYLNQILTVPHVDWPILGDDEWLFGTSGSPAKKPKLAVSDQPEPTREVWAEAMRLEPDDIIALPYVIPY